MAENDDDTAPQTPVDFLVKAAELGARAQSALLQAEMEALARMIPGLGTGAEPTAPPTDAEVESGFDNMPV